MLQMVYNLRRGSEMDRNYGELPLETCEEAALKIVLGWETTGF